MNKISIDRILIVGLGSIGKRHLRLAREMFPTAKIKILRHQPSVDTPEYSDGCFFSHDQALAFKPHIAVIANPAPFHLEIAQILAEIGTHLFIEKPLAVSLDGVEKLHQTCNDKDIVLMIGYNLRFSTSLIKFRELLNKKILGKVLSVRCEIGKYLPSWRPDIDYTRSVSSKKELGGGVLLELSHELDYLNWIFGQADWIRASLFTQSSLKINVEDTAHLILGFNSKEDSYNIIAAVNLDFIRHDNTRFCIAIGEDGTLRWDGITGEVLYYNKDSDEWIEMFVEDQKRDDSYISEWINFIDCISNKKKPVVSIEDGIKVLQIIGAAKKSFKTGKEVRINHDYQTKKVNQ